MCCGARLSAVELGAKGKAAELRDGELVTSKDGGAERRRGAGEGSLCRPKLASCPASRSGKSTPLARRECFLRE